MLGAHMDHPAGTFCFAELVTPDSRAASRFYGGLMEWQTVPVAGSAGSAWFVRDGNVVAGLRQASTGPQHWIPYLSVPDREATVAHALELGAAAIAREDIPGTARVATLRDPSGRVVGVWQDAGRSGVDVQESAGSMWWVEMLARDPAAATEFYRALFGWHVAATRFPHLRHDYTLYRAGTDAVGGALRIEDNWGEVPEGWQVLFAVADLEGTIRTARSLGGRDDFPIVDVAGIGRCVSLLDDQGGLFVVMEPMRR
jgi:predicted enzyme related to lactoylglutathione lyase